MRERGAAAEWDGPGLSGRQLRRFRWSNVLWALIYPQRNQQLVPTISGVLLIALSLGIGMAAYNASNNILFITLALLLACLILSGVVSWLNFARVRWRLLLPPAARAGQTTTLTLELANTKAFLPTYGLACALEVQPVSTDEPARPETTFTAKGRDVRAILAAKPAGATTVLRLPARLDPQGSASLDWAWQPPRRGQWRIALRSVGSFFPFGFFNKKLATTFARDLLVWPAPVEYRRCPAAGARWTGGSERTARTGSGTDLLALRRYAAGDSHRLIHWKASARTGQLLVRQFAAESVEHYTLWLQTEAARWPRPEQFERALSLCATLAEDLFRAGSLGGVMVDGEPIQPVRQVRDLEAWLDRLAVLQPRTVAPGQGGTFFQPNLMTFAPDGPAGAAALIDGKPAATA